MNKIAFLENVVYSENGLRPLPLDIIRPDPVPDSPMPAIIHIHGGGWMGGSKNDYNPNTLFAEAGFFTVNIEYRLSPEAPFPAQIDDVKQAARWLRRNAETYHLDPTRIGAWGHSAGGHLAALLGVSAAPDERIQAVVALSPPTDLRYPEEWNPWPASVLATLFGGPPEQKRELTRQASPLTFVTPDAPPFLIVHGDQDDVVPVSQAERFYRALMTAGCDATLLRLSRAAHSFDAASLNWAWLQALALTFFRHHLELPRQ